MTTAAAAACSFAGKLSRKSGIIDDEYRRGYARTSSLGRVALIYDEKAGEIK